MRIASEQQRENRLREIERESMESESRKEEQKKNRGNFTQVYPHGWKRITELAQEVPSAFKLYTFLAEHIDPGCGAVVCDQQFLADRFGVTTRTIRTWLTKLESKEALVRIPVAGKVCAYALDPRDVWKGYANSKDYAAFVTKTLVNKDGEIKRRIKAMFSGQEGDSHLQQDMLDD
ncbi:helix-turn-helix domain-containing protein [Endozoicomonas sp. SM1973]|uniref:Helix-turn-helix domain-containing protein n=1 Tax=Spartinivicinus marinus TaxID=2994442 RepID=A0A853I8X8_9GAMM|nr:helix-turn-helix domain-containing protein [Spartinivicinus marinus]NYZ69763.1 helix-turn-helix domain-containing protein [Spartinivicinus marinus]